ncbi:MAG: glutathione synthase [Maricaulaceae bacterium]|jgi:glutathione synthase
MLRIAFQMDPIETVDVNADTTFDIAMECMKRGHECWFYLPAALSLDPNGVRARGRRIEELRRAQGEHVALGAFEELDLHGFDVVFLRQDPPFDMAYITSTHLLEHLQPKTLVVNDPASVRNAPEKLFVTRFKDLMPETLISSDQARLIAFFEAYKDIIIKPLYGNGGAGVFRVRQGDENLTSLIELFTSQSREPLIAQRYLPDIRNGDKRIILIDGEPVGAINRIPAEGEVRANLHVGGTAAETQLTKRDQEICTAIGPELRERGLVFVGIDVIGDYITEINVTSPTGVQELRKLSGIDASALLVDAVEAKARR